MPQRTEYHKKNLSIALKGNKNALGNTGYWLGKEKPHTEETNRKCHNWFHRIYGRKNNTLKQVEEFLNYKTYD